MMLHTKYQDSGPYGFRQEDFSMFSLYIKLCNPLTPGGAIFGHRSLILTNLEEVHQVMLHAKYQDSRSYGFRQE